MCVCARASACVYEHTQDKEAESQSLFRLSDQQTVVSTREMNSGQKYSEIHTVLWLLRPLAAQALTNYIQKNDNGDNRGANYRKRSEGAWYLGLAQP